MTERRKYDWELTPDELRRRQLGEACAEQWAKEHANDPPIVYGAPAEPAEPESILVDIDPSPRVN